LLQSLSLPLDDAEVAAGEKAARSCVDSMGPVANRLGTAYVAHDIDAIRRALGAETINYLGYSYGSAIGVWYASLYPEHVRAMVVDGADDVVPEAATTEQRVADTLAEAEGFETQLMAALAACTSKECPIYNGGDPTGAYFAAAANKDLVLDATGAADTALFGIASFLYSEESWPQLWQALADLIAGDPTAIVESATLQQPDDGASFLSTVNCLDSWTLHPEVGRTERLDDLTAAQQGLAEVAPMLAEVFTPPVEACPFFDALGAPTVDTPIAGGDVPILVIGNLSDPATPFVQSERLATEVLSNGYLVETDHYKHGVFPENDCVSGHVHSLLIDNRLPQARQVSCPRQDPTAEPPQQVLAQFCVSATEDLEPAPTEDQLNKICDEFIALVTAGRTDEELAEMLESSDPAVADQILEALATAIETGLAAR
jgi:pimeloyl-ACP methyl ester carboxylesterase